MPDNFDVLHALRVKGLSSDAVLAEMSGIPAADLADRLAPLIEAGLVVRSNGRLTGSSLTPAGRTEHLTRLAEDPGTTGARPQIETFYQAFLPVNGQFKTICHDWQMRSETEPNDHTDTDYDQGVIARLTEVDKVLEPDLAALADALPRFGRYRTRLSAALDRVRGGDNAAFARPMYDSYHDIWMELHQDLLLSLARERGQHDEG
ncbi:MarR family transcriptional regulator [Nocardia sp. NPDC052112]|uniref:MarR family transcriptional regulator n=1 Tax=Nocardia sp. NPDC052112 TaxID=3155646 RepID=UPI00343C61AA